MVDGVRPASNFRKHLPEEVATCDFVCTCGFFLFLLDLCVDVFIFVFSLNNSICFSFCSSSLHLHALKVEVAISSVFVVQEDEIDVIMHSLPEHLALKINHASLKCPEISKEHLPAFQSQGENKLERTNCPQRFPTPSYLLGSLKNRKWVLERILHIIALKIITKSQPDAHQKKISIRESPNPHGKCKEQSKATKENIGGEKQLPSTSRKTGSDSLSPSFFRSMRYKYLCLPSSLYRSCHATPLFSLPPKTKKKSTQWNKRIHHYLHKLSLIVRFSKFLDEGDHFTNFLINIHLSEEKEHQTYTPKAKKCNEENLMLPYRGRAIRKSENVSITAFYKPHACRASLAVRLESGQMESSYWTILHG